jgi:ribosome-associated protein
VLTVPLREIRTRASRSGGPGGQNVNKVESRVEAVWNLEQSDAVSPEQRARLRSVLGSRISSEGSLRVVSRRFRTQARNREAAIERLRALVQDALRPRRRRRPTAPTRAAREARLEEKKRRGTLKKDRSQDYI